MAVAVHLVIRDLGIKPSLIVSTANKSSRGAIDDKLVRRKAIRGQEIISSGFGKVDDASKFLASPPRASTPKRFSYLAEAVVELVGEPAAPGASELLLSIIAQLKDILASAAEYVARQGAEVIPATAPRAKPQPPIESPSDRRDVQARTAVKFIAAEAGISEDTFETVYSTFSGRANPVPPRVNYLCYRFHSNGENVVKSFMAIKAPNEHLPMSLFTNVSMEPNSDAPRISSGLIVPGENRIYFVGAIKGGAALKFLVLSKPPAPRASFVGLTMSIEEDGRPVVARVLLRRTEASRHDDGIEIGHKSIEDVRAEIGNVELDKIRNRIKFKLERGNPVFLDGKPLTSSQLVMEVHKALRDKDNTPLFTDTHHNEFNPADDSHYTYNAGLPIWVDGERD